ncbi:MAG: pyroglutamyl-peptidase I, partial [Proteobacteria bacterium]|nr:pyroglutamyl-peptidase I [Pseudomonadota bacterium]
MLNGSGERSKSASGNGTDRPVVLLTGFGPFPSVPANATTLLVPRIAEAARCALPGLSIVTEILPTEWQASRLLLDELIFGLRPAVAVHFGVASRAAGFEIETRGRNVCVLSEDAAGKLPEACCVTPGGPEHLASTLPSSHIVERLRRRGLPARISRDAGGYLCNALLYRSLERARATGLPARTGFVHLPTALVSERMPALEPRHGLPLGWQDVVEGGVEIVAAAVGRPPLAMRAGQRFA